MFSHPPTEWRIADVERKAEQATSRLYELDSLRRTVDSLECANRQFRSEIDWLRAELNTAIDRIQQIEWGKEEST